MFAFYQRYKTPLKTFSLLSAIALVLILQLGLTTFISTSDITEKSIAIVNNVDEKIAPLDPEATNGVAKLYSEDFVEDRIIPPIQAESQKNTIRASHRVARPLHKAATRPRQIRSPKKRLDSTVAALRPVSKDRQYDSTAVKPSKFSGSEMVADLKKNSGKRSFASAALPIVKKPYSWLKALGSKIF